DVVDVEGLETEVGATAIELVAQVARRHAVRAHHVAGLDDAGAYVGRLEIRAGIARDLGVERQEPPLGRHHDRRAVEAAANGGRQRGADRPLAALVAIVHRRVEHVDAALEGARDRLLVERVGGRVLAAQIGTDADGGCPRATRQLAELLGGNAAREALEVPRGALGGGVSGDHGSHYATVPALKPRDRPRGPAPPRSGRASTTSRHRGPSPAVGAPASGPIPRTRPGCPAARASPRRGTRS